MSPAPMPTGSPEHSRHSSAALPSTLDTLALLEAVRDAVIVTDLKGRVTFWNPFAEGLYGWSANEALGRPVLELLAPAELAGHGRELIQRLAQGESWSGELTVRHRDGSEIIVQVTNTGLRESTGALSGVMSISRDVTDRLHERSVLLRYQMLINRTRDMILVLRRDGSIIDANAAAVEAYGYPRDRLLQLNIRDLRDASTIPELEAQLQAAEAEGVLFETRHLRANGEAFPVEVSSVGTSLDGERLLLNVVRDITTRQEAERRLRESDRLLQRALTASGMFAFSWQPGSDRVERSASATAILGIDPSIENTGQGYFARIHEQDRARFIGLVTGLTPERPGYSTTYRFVRPDGRMVILEETGSAELTADGQLRRLSGLTADVTERLHAEQTLRTTAAQLDAIFRNAPLGLGFWDTDLRFLRINPALAEMNGLPPEAHLGKTPKELFPDLHDLDQVMEQWREVIRTRRPLTGVELVGETLAQPGRQRSWRESFFPVTIGDETIGVAAVVEETTEERLAQAERRHLAELIARAREPVFVWEMDGGITSWNDGAQALYGYRPDEALGQSPHALLHTQHPVPWPEVRAALEREGEWQGELIHRRSDGRDVSVESHKHLAVLDGRKLVMESNRDITERKRLERIQAEFVALAAHELKTPLTSLKGFAQLLQRGLRSDTALETIVQQVNRMDRLVGDLLDVSRLDTGRLELRRRSTDLVALVTQQVEEAQAASARHTFRLRAMERSIVGRWDEDRLVQVLQNLLSNAVKYSPEGGLIDVTVRHDGQEAVVAVRDQGLGMSQEELARIFERFHRLERAKDVAGGMGLGLSITRGIVAAHGGHIWAESAGPGQGAVFVFTLPITKRITLARSPA